MPNPSQPIQVQDAVSVGQITRDIRAVLEGTFPHVRVFGEVVGLARPRSGHIYLTLKDCTGEDDAQLSVVIWRDRAQALRFALEDGMLEDGVTETIPVTASGAVVGRASLAPDAEAVGDARATPGAAEVPSSPRRSTFRPVRTLR